MSSNKFTLSVNVCKYWNNQLNNHKVPRASVACVSNIAQQCEQMKKKKKEKKKSDRSIEH